MEIDGNRVNPFFRAVMVCSGYTSPSGLRRQAGLRHMAYAIVGRYSRVLRVIAKKSGDDFTSRRPTDDGQ